MSEANKTVVRTFIEAFSRGDAVAAEACLAPDATTVAKGFGKLSGERPRALILATTAAFKELIPTGLRPRFVSFIAEGDRVAVSSRATRCWSMAPTTPTSTAWCSP